MERYLVPILATFEALAPLANDPIMLGDQYGLLDTLNIIIFPLFQTEQDTAKVYKEEEEEQE